MRNFFSKLENYFSNRIVQIASLLGLFIGYIGDAVANKTLYWALAGVIIVLLLIAIIDEIKNYDELHTDTIHIPVIIRVDDNTDVEYVYGTLMKKIEQEYGLKNYESKLLKYRGINPKEFIFEYNGDIFEFDRLLSFAQIINYKINQTQKKLQSKVLFHIAYYRRPSVAFMLGSMLRTEGIIVYQNDDGGSTFNKVSNATTRNYKERVKVFEKYDVVQDIQQPEQKDDLLLIINSASHDVNPNVASLQGFANKVTATLKPQTNGRLGSVPPTDEWSDYSSELYTLIHDYRLEYKKITIAHAMPEAMALLVGMAIENYWNIDITQYKDGDNPYIYNMKNVHYYF